MRLDAVAGDELAALVDRDLARAAADLGLVLALQIPRVRALAREVDRDLGQLARQRLQPGDLVDAGHARLVPLDGVVLELREHGLGDHDVGLVDLAGLDEVREATGDEDAGVGDEDTSHEAA